MAGDDPQIVLRNMDATHARDVREILCEAGIRDEIIEYDWRGEYDD